MKKAIFALSFLLVVKLGPAQTVVQAWSQRYDGPANNGNAIAVDGAGDVIVTGFPATIKYSSAGVPLWTNTNNIRANAIAVDRHNDVLVTGESDTYPNTDYVTIKYSSAGIPLWTNFYNGPGNGRDFAPAVAVDNSNNVVVTGASLGTGTGSDFATIKYRSDGVPLWTNRFNTPDNHTDSAYAVAVDGDKNVIVTGASAVDWVYTTIKYASDGEPLWLNRDLGAGGVVVGLILRVLAVDSQNNIIVAGDSPGIGGGTGYATIKYSSDGLSLWTNRYHGPETSFSRPHGVAVDSEDNIIVTGLSIESGHGSDYATIKYSAAGAPLWTNRFNGLGNGADSPQAVAVDSLNNVIVTGQSHNGTNSDYTTIAYSSAGVALWTNSYNGPGNGVDSASAVAVDRRGNVFVTGTSWNGTNYGYATIKYAVHRLPIPLMLQSLNHQLVLSWTNPAFGLQSASSLSAPFTDIPGATSPYTNSITGDQQFFRLISD